MQRISMYYVNDCVGIWEDDFIKFENTTRLIAHARSAFKDRDIKIENNMPFYDHENIFVFNGELNGVKLNVEGRIGAEKIFNFIKRFDKEGIKAALSKGVEIIKKQSSYVRAMNIIIADKNKAYVTSNFNEDSEYFTMYCKETNGTTIICSEMFPEENNWTKIENNSIGVY